VRAANNLAVSLLEREAYGAAEDLLRPAIAAFPQLTSTQETQRTLSRALDNLAWACRGQERYDEADSLYRQGLKIHEKLLGPDHLDVAQSCNNLALVLIGKSCLTEAESQLQRALTIRETALGSGHEKVSTTLANLAFLHMTQGHTTRGLREAIRALEICRKRLGDNHPRTQALLAWLHSLSDDAPP